MSLSRRDSDQAKHLDRPTKTRGRRRSSISSGYRAPPNGDRHDSPVASANGWPSPVRSSGGLDCCSSMNPPETSTRTTATEILDLLTELHTGFGLTIIAATHDQVIETAGRKAPADVGRENH